MTAETLGLKIIPINRGKPVFPLTILMNRFSDGSDEQDQIKEMKKTFETEFGEADAGATGGGVPQNVRASATCDYSVDEGLRPLDISRCVDLACKPIAEFTAEAWANSGLDCLMTKNRFVLFEALDH